MEMNLPALSLMPVVIASKLLVYVTHSIPPFFVATFTTPTGIPFCSSAIFTKPNCNPSFFDAIFISPTCPSFDLPA
jgi:hypothetical protein